MTPIVSDTDAGSAPERKPSLRDRLAHILEWVIPLGLVVVIVIGMALVLSGRV